MITFTKEQLISSAQSRIEFAEMLLSGRLEPLKERTWSIELELARIALASLEARTEQQLNVPDKMTTDPNADVIDPGFVSGWNACRDAMLDSVPFPPLVPAPVVPDGWVTAPADPTMKMALSGASAKRDDASELWNANAIYHAMLAAATREGE